MEPGYTVFGYMAGQRPDPNYWRELQPTFDGDAHDMAEHYHLSDLNFVVTMAAYGEGRPIKIKQWDSLPAFRTYLNNPLAESDVPKLWNAAVPRQYQINAGASA